MTNAQDSQGHWYTERIGRGYDSDEGARLQGDEPITDAEYAAIQAQGKYIGERFDALAEPLRYWQLLEVIAVIRDVFGDAECAAKLHTIANGMRDRMYEQIRKELEEMKS